ncbi:MAG: methyltransferase domain-containing protein [Pseudomonadota bacterium]
MNQVLSISGHRPIIQTPDILIDEYHLEWLCTQIVANRFLPVPPEEAVFVGDGDYRAIGAEFLSHFVRMGGLQPHHDVLDIGCGIGRMAVPLTQYLDAGKAHYEGFDPVAGGIKWCSHAISRVYPNFRFQTFDVRNALYNPQGAIDEAGFRLPFDEGAFDFAAMVSVATHLPPREIELYCAEISRVLRPGGRLFLTAFIIGDATELSDPKCDQRLRGFVPVKDQPCWYLEGENPMAAVGFDDGFIDGVIKAAGLALRKKSFGSWRGHESGHYQDVLIAEKPRKEAA